MSQYKLVYFNGRGKAETTRLIFAVAGQEYEDFRFEREDWPKHKPNMPFGQVPVLEVKDCDKVTVIAQSKAINRFLANRFNLAGNSDLDKARVDMVVEQLNDLLSSFSAYKYEENEDRKKALGEKLFSEIVPQNVKYFEKLLEQSQTPFFGGDELSFADLSFLNGLDYLGDKKEHYLESAPLLKALAERVKNTPKVAEWLEKRPVTEF